MPPAQHAARLGERLDQQIGPALPLGQRQAGAAPQLLVQDIRDFFRPLR